MGDAYIDCQPPTMRLVFKVLAIKQGKTHYESRYHSLLVG
ncbi:hypothetical protein BPUTEOMOX_137 [methanotrophic endosymbiont of Bathymodiolus puteoserpentis (Logatchev)]|nr:hypothetical protein BPUTEOMOX_137 [methanotrophic endosymbiont of Bathymodiolus puteoserpentis (Logatchev)]